MDKPGLAEVHRLQSGLFNATAPLKQDKLVRDDVFGWLAFPLGETRGNVRKECIALDLSMDNSQINFVHQRNGLAKNDLPAADKCLIRPGTCRKGRSKVVDNNASGCGIALLARKHDVRPQGQRPANAFEGLSSQDDGMPASDPVEPSAIRRQIPWHLIIQADYAVLGHGGDNGKNHGFRRCL